MSPRIAMPIMSDLWKRWKPAGYVLASLTLSLGGLANGYDTGSIGGVVVMDQFHDVFGELSPTMHGFTVSFVMLAGSFSSLFAGQMADRIGRLPTIGIGAVILLLGQIFQGAAFWLPMFLVGRMLAGLGQGFLIGNIAVYIAELAPSARRGVLVSTFQLMVVTGICLGYFTCYGTVKLPSSLAWRIPYIIQGSMAIILAISCRFIPESPRWLMLHNRREKAMEAIEKLDIHREEAEKDILRVVDADHARLEPSLIQNFILPFRRQYRMKTGLALFVLGMVQLSGIDGVLYYAPTLFEQAGLPAKTAGFVASGVSALLMLLISIIALVFADSWPRRTSFITGGVILSSCMLLIGSLYASDSVHSYGIARWVVVVAIFVFALAYCGTWAIVGKLYAGEIQPAKTRAAANGVAQALNFFANWVVAMITPIFLAKSSYGPYFLYSGLCMTTAAIVTVYMPETRGRSLESIQEAFQRPAMNWLSFITSRLQNRHPSQDSPSGSSSSSAVELSSSVASASSMRVEAAAV
ncbi:MAG: hypothetical protein M1828_004201 [Chrysothrix sp. TS-e1954]|nr:MAG: hypothetical protein M1828_004201 [Chrysothrix sp. TS-e1954]